MQVTGSRLTFGLSTGRGSDLQRIRDDLAAANAELASGRRGDVHAGLGQRAVEAISVRSFAEIERGQIVVNEQTAGRLSVMSDVLSGVRGSLQAFLEIAVPNRSGPTPTVAAVGDAARTAFDAVAQHLNASYAGAALFAGIDGARTVVQGWSQTNAATGSSPRDAVAGAIGGRLIDSASVTAVVADVAAVFQSGPAGAFEGTIYNGTPSLGSNGQPSARLAVSIGGGAVLDYGIQANDAPFVEVMRGLSMLAAAPPHEIDDTAAYAEWVDAAMSAVEGGVAGVANLETRLGGQQARLDAQMRRQEDLVRVLEGRTLALEGVDPHEAATRVINLTNALEASYAATARIGNLTYLDYMR